MKKNLSHIIVCFALLLSHSLSAGDFANSPYNKGIVSINQGYIFSGSGDCWGISNEISYLKSINRSFFHMESLSGWIVNGNSWIDGGFENQTGISLAANIGFVPFKTGNRIFYLAGGGTLGFLSNVSTNYGAQYNYTYKGQTQTLSRAYYDAGGYLTPGFTVSAGYITRVNSRIYLNIRAQTQAYHSGDIVSSLSVGIGLNALNN